MPLNDAILGPFVADNARPRFRRLWLILLLGAPLLLAAGFWLQHRNNQHRNFTLSIDRQGAIAIARRVAAENGFDASTWTPYVRFERNEKTVRYFEQRPASRTVRSRQFAPDGVVTTLLVARGNGVWCTVATGPDGFVIATRFGGRTYRPRADGFSEAQSLAAAEADMRRWIGDMALDRLGEPEVSTTEEAGVPGARRFVWRVQPRRQPELELVFTFDVAGNTIAHREVAANYAESFAARVLTPGTSLRQLAGMLRTFIIIALSLYAGYRFARRALEHEAPHRRSFLLGASLLVCSTAAVLVDPYIYTSDLRPDRIQGPVLFVQLTAILVSLAMQSLLLGIAYGAGEGEVREGWPGKLTSLDTLLNGHVFSANVGASVVAGIAFGAWLFALSQLAFSRFAPGADSTVEEFINLSVSRAPLLVLLINLPILCVFNSVIYLLVPLTFLRRHLRATPLLIVLLTLIALAGGKISRQPDIGNPAYWIETAGLVVAILVPFFLADYLASVAAAIALTFFCTFGDLAATMPSWHAQIGLMSALAGATVLPLAIAAWRGRRYDDAEVRPAHARNLIQRLSLQAEVNAARQAQLRLLPAHPPRIHGLSIAASCTPAGDVGGDFYDFFPLPDGRLGMIVAEGGNDGLASALTIALAKGFLRYESSDNSDIEQILLRLEQALGSSLRRTSGRTSLALFLLDPARGVLHVARSGTYPRILILSADHAVSEFVPKPHQGGPGVESDLLALAPGDFIFIHTDGLPRLLARQSAGSPSDLLTRAAHLHHLDSAASLHNTIVDLLLTASNQTTLELSDDLTAVTIRFESAISLGEAVA
jgi:sigma-B regulation protein RsbU (phosphoserine phosphatase)